MRVLHLLQAKARRPLQVKHHFEDARRFHLSNLRLRNTGSRDLRLDGQLKESEARKVSLFDELFPKEEQHSQIKPAEPDCDATSISRLPLSDLDHLDTSYRGKIREEVASRHTEAAAQGALKHWKPAILVLSRASKSLVDADFRRIAPKGRHIEEWTGPGDIIKVIPGRDPVTFQQRNHYFLLFPNPSYARTYQNYVVKLHKLVQTHAPTSLQSPLPPPAGSILDGEDVQTLYQDYALCPPSQGISLVTIFAPFGSAVQPLVDHQGYAQLTSPVDRVGRAVLFWVDGYVLTTHAIRSMVDQDGRDRGLPWAMEKGGRHIEKLDLSNVSLEDLDHSEQTDFDAKRRLSPRWILSFVDENEARRFVRAWHKKPFPIRSELIQSEDAPLANVEFLW